MEISIGRMIDPATERHLERQIPRSLYREASIQRAIAGAVLLDDFRIIKITKQIQDSTGIVRLRELSVDHPFEMPSASSQGSNNQALQQFVSDAYISLADYYGHHEWRGWSVLPYLPDEDGMRSSFCLGVFAEEFDKTVVE